MARTLALLVTRYLRQLHPLARIELASWHERARRIPDRRLREQAISTLISERANAEGAALFAGLAAPRWAPSLVRASVAYQVMYDYLDTVTETPVANHAADCTLLHQATLAALDRNAPIKDWYALHPSRNDGGYLTAFVREVRSVCADLPAYDFVAPRVRASARRAAEVQTLAHCTPGNVESLRTWAAQLIPDDPSLRWFEHAAGASSTLDIHTLFALATEPDTRPARVNATHSHLTALCGLNTLLESLVDLPDDLRTGDYSYISHYRTAHMTAGRLGHIARRARSTAASTSQPAAHLAILTAMASLYLARSTAWHPGARRTAHAILTELPLVALPMAALQVLRSRVRWA